MRQKFHSLRKTISTTLTLNDGMHIHRLRVPQDFLTAYVSKQGKKDLLAKKDQLEELLLSAIEVSLSVENTNVQSMVML